MNRSINIKGCGSNLYGFWPHPYFIDLMFISTDELWIPRLQAAAA